MIVPILGLALLAAPAPADSQPAVERAPFALLERAAVASRGDGRTGLDEPAGIAVDAFGRVTLADAGRHRVQQLDADGTPRWESGALGSGEGTLRRPSAVALLGTLLVAVLDVENRRIVAFDLLGRPQPVFADLAALEESDPIGRIDPLAMASDRGGALYLADAERDRVVAFDFSGRLLGAIGGLGAKPGSFRGLRGLAVTPRGELVTAERGNPRVQRLSAGGRPIESWPLDVAPGRARLAVAADDSGRVAVADPASGSLWLFARGGRTLARLAGLAGPAALAWAPDGTLLIAEGRGGRVRRFALEPAPPVPTER